MQQLLGGMSAQEFLRDFWQKRPLLIKGAVPDFQGLVDWGGIQQLAMRDDALSRLVEFRDGRWGLEQGPFTARRLGYLDASSNWSVLVSNLNHFLPAAAELLYRFNFIPYARLDDLMVSYALAGGGVGPHFDSYDVFLLQGGGRKRWQISSQQDQSLVEGAPLRILQNFTPEQEWLLEPGDMLYLPPKFAHNGIAVEPGMTYSIGFRAPSTQELAAQFLLHLSEYMQLDGMYADPDLLPHAHPAEIGPDMLAKVGTMLEQIRWNETDIAHFLGVYLSGPKNHVFFDEPVEPLEYDDFVSATAGSGVALDLKSQILFCGNAFFINGEEVSLEDVQSRAKLVEFADLRTLPAQVLPERLLEQLFQWYQCGYISVLSNS